MSKYKIIDLFAGIGGIRLGFENAFGKLAETVFASEIDPYAQITYSANFEDNFEIAGDITKIHEKYIPDFDICLAGFPCQAFSIAGNRQGFNDDYHGTCRGTLFLDVVRICDYHKPKIIFCENVKGLLMNTGGGIATNFQVIFNAFKQIGYNVHYKILNSKDFGLAQNRERVYIVCFRNDIDDRNFKFPEPANKKVVLKDILEDAPISSKYYLSTKYLDTLRKHKERHQNAGNGFGYIVRNLNDIAGALVCGGMGREKNLIVDNRQHSTVPVTRIVGEINSEDIRKLTPREWARLQGFPESFKLIVADTHLYKQFGNTVSINVIEAITKNILEILK